MRSGRIKFAIFLLSLSLACAVPSLLAKKRDTNSASGQNDQKRAVHALNRLTFGPRPGDVEQVVVMGVDKWIDLQLHPDKIKNDALESRLAPLGTLRMSTREIVEEFPDPQLIKAVMEGKKPMPSDAAKRAVYQVEIARLHEKKERKAEVANNAATAPPANDANAARENAAPMAASNAAAENEPSVNQNSMSSSTEVKLTPEEDAEARRREAHLYADLKVQQLIDLPAEERYRKVLAMSTDEQVAFADSLRGGKGQEFAAGMDPKQKETLLAMNNPPGVVVDELVQAKLLRTVYSERQLEEVMTDFWFNHFNVYQGKGLDRLLLTSYEQDVIRPRVFGKFEDLLVATAQSPAMLFYLDNWLSVGPNSAQALGMPVRPVGPYGPYRRFPGRFPGRFPRPNTNAKRRQNSGLNENYGRELLELHTLSVNGGYSQRDVTEVAKVFTGWTIDKPFEGGGFRYDARMHEPGPKFVLGHHITPKGEDEGRELLHRLATSPQTAHFISLKLAQRFVSDDPPQALVDSMAKTFLKKKGDIREVLTTLFHSPEFWATDTYRAKMKTPLEFLASALRATAADVEDALPLAHQLGNMGMPLYGAQPPTGYSMKAETWVNSSALLNRLNFALALTSGTIRGVKLNTTLLAGNNPPPADAVQTITTMAGSLFAGNLSKQTQDSIVAQIVESEKSAPGTMVNDKDRKVVAARPAQPARAPNMSTIAGLLLGSPEFQRR